MSVRSGLVGKILPAPFGAISGNFLHGPEDQKIAKTLHILLGGPMGPFHPVLGLLLSARGGKIGIDQLPCKALSSRLLASRPPLALLLTAALLLPAGPLIFQPLAFPFLLP